MLLKESESILTLPYADVAFCYLLAIFRKQGVAKHLATNSDAYHISVTPTWNMRVIQSLSIGFTLWGHMKWKIKSLQGHSLMSLWQNCHVWSHYYIVLLFSINNKDTLFLNQKYFTTHYCLDSDFPISELKNEKVGGSWPWLIAMHILSRHLL